MKPNTLPRDAETLFALARAIADVVAKSDPEQASADIEVRLRAGIAAATFARSAYLAILHGTRLHRRMTTSLAEIQMLLDPNDPSSVTDFVLTMDTDSGRRSAALL